MNIPAALTELGFQPRRWPGRSYPPSEFSDALIAAAVALAGRANVFEDVDGARRALVEFIMLRLDGRPEFAGDYRGPADALSIMAVRREAGRLGLVDELEPHLAGIPGARVPYPR